MTATTRHGGLRAAISIVSRCPAIVATGDEGYGKKDCKQEIPGQAGNDNSRKPQNGTRFPHSILLFSKNKIEKKEWGMLVKRKILENLSSQASKRNDCSGRTSFSNFCLHPTHPPHFIHLSSFVSRLSYLFTRLNTKISKRFLCPVYAFWF